MTVEIETLCVGPLDVNCYIVGCSEHKVAAVVDPGDAASRITALLEKKGWTAHLILNTHAHADHVGANEKMRRATGAPLLIHPADAFMLTHPDMADMAAWIGVESAAEPDRHMEDGDQIPLCPCASFKVHHTPGHTPGSVCLEIDGRLITGDTLFRYSIGRTDLLGGDPQVMQETLSKRICALPDELVALPGHGDPTTIGEEKRLNPYLVDARR